MLWIHLGGALAVVPDAVLWYHGHGGTTLDNGSFVAHIETSLFGSVDQIDTWSQVVLDDYRVVILARPTEDFDATEAAQIAEWLALGRGQLIVAGDQDASANPAAMNALLAELGVGLRLAGDTQVSSTGMCAPTEVVETSPLFSFGNSISVVSHSSVLEGTPLVNRQQIDPPGVWTVAAREGSVVLTGDYDFFTSDVCGLVAKQAFWNQLYAWGCDYDEDGFRDPSCGGNDCDDTDAQTAGSDDYIDADQDGYGGELDPCGANTVTQGGDCDDELGSVNPGADEICDGVDNDCDLSIDVGAVDGMTFFADGDGDGYGAEEPTVVACEAPDGFVADAGDCNDTSATMNPDEDERCNGLDDNCDGTVDEGCVPPPPPPPPKKTCATSPVGVGALSLWMVLSLVRRRGRR